MTGSLAPWGGPILRRITLVNSITVTEEDAIEASSGFAALGTAANSLLGHVRSTVTFDGVGLTDKGTASGIYDGTFGTASDNQTVAQVSASTDISKHTLYSAELDATIGTTTGSDLLGYFMDLIDEDTLDETDASTSAAQYFNHGVDPLDSTKALVNLFESMYFGPL